MGLSFCVFLMVKNYLSCVIKLVFTVAKVQHFLLPHTHFLLNILITVIKLFNNQLLLFDAVHLDILITQFKELRDGMFHILPSTHIETSVKAASPLVKRHHTQIGKR